jgi:hypothetical protein
MGTWRTPPPSCRPLSVAWTVNRARPRYGADQHYPPPGHRAIAVAKRSAAMISPGAAPARRHSVTETARRSSLVARAMTRGGSPDAQPSGPFDRGGDPLWPGARQAGPSRDGPWWPSLSLRR